MEAVRATRRFITNESIVRRVTWFVATGLEHLGVLGDDLELARVSSAEEFASYLRENSAEFERRRFVEGSLIPSADVFHVRGFCILCGRFSPMRVGYEYSFDDPRGRRPNWREHLTCACGLNCRMRAAVHAFERVLHARRDHAIYLMEQSTPLYRRLRLRYGSLVGSEYLGSSVSRGHTVGGIRNEDAMHLSFADAAFDAILSFDVFEHVPDHRRAFRECRRCLKSGGHLLFSVPFVVESQSGILMAQVNDAGVIEHCRAPEYHPNPIDERGSLCFRYFRWAMLRELKEDGFRNVEVLLIWSRKFAYLGGYQLLFVATT